MTTDWHKHAACEGQPYSVFFVGDGQRIPGRLRLKLEEPARRLCAGCPVQPDCLDWAIATGEKYGIWGGMNTAERNRYARSVFV